MNPPLFWMKRTFIFSKPENGYKSLSCSDGSTDQREMPRGTGAIFAACDVVFQLSRAEEGAMRMEQTKARGGKAVDPFIIRVDDVGEAATTVLAKDCEESQTVSPIDAIKPRILTLLVKSHDLRSKNEVVDRVKGSKPTKLLALKELEDRGLVVVAGGVYRLASEVK